MSSPDSEDDERRQLARLIRLYRRELRQPFEYVHFIPVLMKELVMNDIAFANHFGIDRYEFEVLHGMIKRKIRRTHSRFRYNIGSRERLAISLRFLASGKSMRSLSRHYDIPLRIIPILIREMCTTISSHLMPIVMKKPTQKMWEKIAQDFKKKFDMPNCIGAIEGKNLYVKLKRQKIILLALVDAQDRFIMVDVGHYRLNLYHGNVMDKSKMGKQFMKNEFNVPQNQPLTENSEPLPFVILGSSSFPAKPYLMTKYSKPECAANDTNRMFNTRLSRAKVTVNRTLMRMRNRWRVFQGPLPVPPSEVEKIVLSCCCLHNLFGLRAGQPFLLDYPDSVVAITDDRLNALQSLVPAEPVDIRDKFKKYFLSPEGQVPWQWHDIID